MKVEGWIANGLTLETNGKLELTEVRISAVGFVSGTPSEESMKVAIDLGSTGDLQGDRLIAVARYVVTAYSDDSTPQSDDFIWRASVRAEAEFAVRPDVDPISPLSAHCFSITTGTMAMHPYVRSTVQQLVIGAGYPAYGMAFLRGDWFVDAEDGQVDLPDELISEVERNTIDELTSQSRLLDAELGLDLNE